MTRISPKYFHFFVFSLFLDIFLISTFELLLIDSNLLLEIIALWTLSKFILYPSKNVRRYVSLERVLKLGFKQILLFSGLFAIVYSFENIPYLIFLEHLSLLASAVTLSKTAFVAALKVYRSLGFSFNRFITVGAFPDKNLIVHFLTRNPREGNRFICHFDQIDDIKNLTEFLVKNEINEIFCCSQSLSNIDLDALMKISIKHDISLNLLADENIDAIKQKGENYNTSEISDFSLLLSPKNLLFKRITDIIISGFVIVFILSWLVPIIGIIIKLDSKGPVFFSQPRAGKNGVYFYCFKFRSMRTSAGDDQASKNDSRVTKVGRFLRKTSLDEFPQFVNVFIGDMSIVGPRPHIKSLNDKYDNQISRYVERLLVKPGITGLSQVAGYRGETKDHQSMHNRIRVDLLYIKSWSPMLDLKIFLSTFVKTLFTGDQQAY